MMTEDEIKKAEERMARDLATQTKLIAVDAAGSYYRRFGDDTGPQDTFRVLVCYKQLDFLPYDMYGTGWLLFRKYFGDELERLRESV